MSPVAGPPTDAPPSTAPRTVGGRATSRWGRTDAGKPIRRHVRGSTRTEVAEKVAALESERARSGHRPSPSQQLTLGQWLDEWLVIIQRTRKPKTFDNYTSLLRAHCGPLRSRPLARIAVRDIDDLLYRVAEQFPQSAVALHRILRSALNTAVRRGLLVANPCTHAVVPRVREVELEPYALEECRRLLLAATELPNGARWSVALALGSAAGRDPRADVGRHRLREAADQGAAPVAASRLAPRLRRPPAGPQAVQDAPSAPGAAGSSRTSSHVRGGGRWRFHRS